MALQLNYTSPQGATSASGYIRISDFRGDKNNISFTVECFYNKDARDNGLQPLEYKHFEIATPTTDMLPALYNHLKTLPEFAGALDV